MPDREDSTAVRAVLLDIEGTIAPISYVFDVLFPFARRRLLDFLTTHWTRPDVEAARRRVARDAASAAQPAERVTVEQQLTAAAPADLTAHLAGLMDRDVKATGLKAIQGLIWEQGYAAGELRSELFPDVAPALRRWHAAGLGLWIYSSGSVAAQRVFLQHTADGDLTPLISGYFDTTTGPKQSPDSYHKIAAAISRVRPSTHHSADSGGVRPAHPSAHIGGSAPVPHAAADSLPPSAILFFSDIVAELDAAAAAGLQTRLTLRPGNKPVGPHPHATLRSLAEA